MADEPGNFLLRWFRELVKNKMSALAIPIAGISVSLTILTFSKLFDFPIGPVIAWAGVALMLFMIGLLGLSAYVLVTRNLKDPPKKPPERRHKDQSDRVAKGADTPMGDLSKRKPQEPLPENGPKGLPPSDGTTPALSEATVGFGLRARNAYALNARQRHGPHPAFGHLLPQAGEGDYPSSGRASSGSMIGTPSRMG